MGSRAGNRPWLRQWPSLRVMKSETESGLACSTHHRGTTMEHYAGIDVSLESASICVVDASGQIVREAQVASEPEALIAWFRMSQVGSAWRLADCRNGCMRVCGRRGYRLSCWRPGTYVMPSR